MRQSPDRAEWIINSQSFLQCISSWNQPQSHSQIIKCIHYSKGCRNLFGEHCLVCSLFKNGKYLPFLSLWWIRESCHLVLFPDWMTNVINQWSLNTLHPLNNVMYHWNFLSSEYLILTFLLLSIHANKLWELECSQRVNTRGSRIWSDLSLPLKMNGYWW